MYVYVHTSTEFSTLLKDSPRSSFFDPRAFHDSREDTPTFKVPNNNTFSFVRVDGELSPWFEISCCPTGLRCSPWIFTCATQ